MSSSSSSLKDKEKTPIASGGDTSSQNVISRLESKYSDILDRVAKRKEKQRQQNEDRDKTLEPPDITNGSSVRRPNALMKSATTANVSKSSFASASTTQKERTPFRMERNKHKYNNGTSNSSSSYNNNNLDNYDAISTSSTSSSIASSSAKMKRSDLLGTASNNDIPSYSKLKSHDSGYYDGNYYKSKYEDLLSDVTSNRHTPKKTTTAYTGSSTSRQLRPYKRTDSTNGEKQHRTAINLYDILDNDTSSNGSTASSSGNYRRTYSQRKSTGTGLRTAASTYNDSYSTTDDSSDDFLDFEKKERENRRKEIQSLIMKYAQLDDFTYSKSSVPSRDDNNNSNTGSSSSLKSIKDKNNNIDPWDLKQSPVVIPMKSSQTKPSSQSQFNALGKSQTMAEIQSNYDYDSSWYGSNYSNSSISKGSNVVPITTYAQKSSSKSRMSKALSTFVRITFL